MIQLVLILEIFGLQVDFNGWHSASWSLGWHQAQTAARSSCSHVSAGVQELDSGGVVASPDALGTVRHRGMETGISEASKRVSIFSFATHTDSS